MGEDEGQIVNFERICRLCLHEKRTLTDIFASDNTITDNNSFSIDQKIMACAKIDLSKGDGLPSRICIKCLTSVNAAFDFRIQCENADKTLHILHNLLTNETDRDKTDKAVVSVDVELGNVEQTESDSEKKETKWNLESIMLKEENGINIETSRVKQDWNGNDFAEESELPVDEFLQTSLSSRLNEKKSVKKTYVRRRALAAKVHRCEPCGKSFNARKSLVRHNLNCHGTETEKRKKLHECSVCTEIFTRWTDLYEHQKNFSHHEKEKCEYCDKYFSRSYMIGHLRNHTGEKPYLCNLCGRSFGQVSSFYKHKKLCSNAEKKLKCSFCDRRYYEKYTLMEHERIHTNEKPFICETCGKAFRRKGKLHIHQLSHTNVKPHTCTVCNRSFRQRGHLTEHLRIHSGVKPFTCDICGAAFTQGHSLKTHKTKHPEGKENVEQLILIKKEDGETIKDHGNYYYIIKDEGDFLEGMLSDAEIVYYDNGSNSEPSTTGSTDGKMAMEEEEEEEEEEMEEGEEEEEEEEEELEGDGEMVGVDSGEGKLDFQLNSDGIGEKRYKVLIKSTGGDFGGVKDSQPKSYKKIGDELQKSPCPFCNKLLTRVDEHIRLMHRNKVYICNKFDCGAQFATLKNLQSHQLTCYDVEKAYKCPHCFKEFHRKSNYKAHVRRHNSKKEFQCQLCESAFVDTTGLRRHFLKHHEPEREVFVSNCCGKRFKSKEGLKKHVSKRICGIEVLQVVDPSPIEVPM